MKETITITPVASSVRVRTVDDGKGTIEHFLQYKITDRPLAANLERWFTAKDGSVRLFYNVPPPPEAK